MAYIKQEYKKFRVRTPVKSFRDLEVYRQTVLLTSDIFILYGKIKKSKKAKDQRLAEEFDILYKLAKTAPKLIAESYGDRFSNFQLGITKLEQTMRIISNIVTKVDCIGNLIESEDIKESLYKVVGKYQKQRVKINNLRRAWLRVREGRGEYKQSEFNKKKTVNRKQ